MRPREGAVSLYRALVAYAEKRGLGGGACYRRSWNRLEFVFGTDRVTFFKVKVELPKARSEYASVEQVDDDLYDLVVFELEVKLGKIGYQGKVGSGRLVTGWVRWFAS